MVLVMTSAAAQLRDIQSQYPWPNESVGIGPAPEGDDEDEDNDERLEAACYLPDPVRFADCGNGTVTDQVTGLVWLKNATCMPIVYYAEANWEVASLGEGTHPECGLADGSSPGDWRLPTRDEWDELVQQALANGCYGLDDFLLPDTQGLGCWTEGDPFTGAPDGFPLFWSSTTAADVPGAAWGVNLRAFVGLEFGKWGKQFVDEPDGDDDVSPPLRVWPVRRGAGR
jgi:hypothetical protein